MKTGKPIALALGAVLAGATGRADLTDSLDRLDQALTFSGWSDQVRAQVTGLLDAEGYAFPQPPPGFIVSQGNALFAPRLRIFLDAQAGPHLYAFGQFRVDRGFDPRNGSLGGRLDEFALRLMPGDGRAFSLQVGKFATLVGNWTARHDSWTEPFVTAPLPYDNLTGVWDAFPARSGSTLLAWAHLRPFPAADLDASKMLRLPIVWGPSYATGAAATGAAGDVTYAIEFKNASLSSRPYLWDPREQGWDNPTVSARLGYRPGPAWSFGISASEGGYLESEARPFLPANTALRQYRQIVVAQDIAFARHHFQLWAEAFETRFAIPLVGNADTLSYYVEAKQTLAPQWFVAARWNQQLYGSIPVTSPAGPSDQPWGRDAWRADAVVGHRFSPRLQAKLQYSAQQGGGVAASTVGHTVAGQLTLRL